MIARIETLQRLEIFEVTTQIKSDESTHCCKDPNSSRHVIYSKQTNHEYPRTDYNHFPIILNQDGSLWPHANRYLLKKIKSIIIPAYKTLESTACDLQHFRRWLDEENIDYLIFPKRVFARPTYRYCAHLHDKINTGDIGRNTAKRRMNTIQNFYRWLTIDGISFDYPLWQESDSYIAFRDGKGIKGTKQVKSTDLASSIRCPKQNKDYSEHLDDGGKLRPLPLNEQKAVVEALKCIANPEMTLSFFLALTTGARLQTVFTLRREHFELPMSNQQVIPIKVGIGTLVDTKYNKPMVLLIPQWLYQRINIYLQSERALRRFKHSQYVYASINQQYVFLTHSGFPYCISNQDPFIDRYKMPPRGNAITQFISQQLSPKLENNGHSFSFRFHDLRATFGMNLLEEKLSQSTDQAELFKILMYVRDRMGHTTISTTENYLNFRKNYHLAISIQSEFEKYLVQQIENVPYDLG